MDLIGRRNSWCTGLKGLSTHGQGRGRFAPEPTGIKTKCLVVPQERNWWNVVMSRRDGVLLYESMCATR